MKVFFSWSGSESRQIAEILAKWLRTVLQSVDTYISSQDIQKGERWGPSISGNLAELDFGIVVLTKDNLKAPWVSFEAGALSKNVGLSRVIPVLCDLTDSDLTKHPLSQFQYAKLDRSDLFDLVRAINASAERKLPDLLLSETFDRWWDVVEAEIATVSFEKTQTVESDDKISPAERERIERLEASVDEILRIVRRSVNARRFATPPPPRPIASAAADKMLAEKFRADRPLSSDDGAIQIELNELLEKRKVDMTAAVSAAKQRLSDLIKESEATSDKTGDGDY